jgi:hypothetical protein
MKFYGNANLQHNQLQNAELTDNIVISPLSAFPVAHGAGHITFVNDVLYICSSTTPTDVWIPLTTELTAYSWEQSTPSDSWEITHNLNTADVGVIVYDSTSKAIVPDEILVTGVNTVTVTFSSLQTGKAVVITGKFDGPPRTAPGGELVVSWDNVTDKPTINTLVPTQAGNAGKFLTTNGSTVSWTALKPSRVFTVGIDAATIQGCIDLCTSASASNVYAIMIPPGVYTENLTLKGSVVLIGMGNSLDTKTVVIKGTHTFTGSAVQVLDNRFSLGNLLLDANGATTTPHFTLAGTTTAQIDIVGCNVQHTSSSTASVAFSLGSNITLYFIDSWLTMNQNSGTGGTQFSLSSGNLYIMNSVTFGGTRVFEQTGAGYIQTTFSTLSCGGDNAVRIYGNGSAAFPFPSSGLLSMGWSTLQNTGANGNGINLLAAGASVGAFGCTFDVLAGASNYVVTGVAGTSFSSANNMYTNIPGILSRNVKIKNTVTALAYTSSLTSSA